MKITNRVWKIVDAVFSLEISKGHLKWKVSDIARFSQINRSLIYYYLGKTKREIFDQCLIVAGEDFFGISEYRMELIKRGQVQACLNLTRVRFQKHPQFMVFYAKWRVTKSPIQKLLIQLEKRYQKKLKTLFQNLSEDQIIALQSIIQGITWCPILDEKTFKIALSMVNVPKQNNSSLQP